jgi:periplasmic protein TonB
MRLRVLAATVLWAGGASSAMALAQSTPSEASENEEAQPVYAPRPPPAPPPPPLIIVSPPLKARTLRSAAVPLNAGEWITADDYPPSSIRTEESGTVQFLVKVGTDGRVLECKILASNASPTLDAQTCRLVTLRGRFTPARDKRRKAMIDTYTSRVRWTIPE